MHGLPTFYREGSLLLLSPFSFLKLELKKLKTQKCKVRSVRTEKALVGFMYVSKAYSDLLSFIEEG